MVGASGGGKSTVLRVILGFIAPSGGRVLVRGATAQDGEREVDLTELAPDHWRTRIGWVPQEPHLVSPATTGATTVADAVRLGRPDASVEDIRTALAAAGVLDEIESLPEGVRTVIGEGGAGLSAGQVRRVALARALIRPVDLLLLDEPTAALDGASEAAVITALQQVAQSGVAVVVVAHRPALIDIADVVVHVGAPDLPERLTPTERELLDAEAQADRSVRGTLTGSGW